MLTVVETPATAHPAAPISSDRDDPYSLEASSSLSSAEHVAESYPLRKPDSSPIFTITSSFTIVPHPNNINWELLRFLGLCLCWYLCSAVSNNIAKQLMNIFQFPVTLTWVQFGFVSLFSATATCIPGLRLKKIMPISNALLLTVVPLAVFQILGHIFSSISISTIPVSVSHTIKALSPLFTVLIYRSVFKIIYGSKVYVSLIPLTLGVMLVCLNRVTFNLVGCSCALAATLIFVLQNVWFKKLFVASAISQQSLPTAVASLPRPQAARGSGTAFKLDKLNMLFYSSTLAFLFMIPIWLYSDGTKLMAMLLPKTLVSSLTGGIAVDSNTGSIPRIVYGLFFLNGLSNFLQTVIAFLLLSQVSPVTYSIASLVKRIFVILASIAYFQDSISIVQASGIGLTFVGLYMYDTAKSDVAKGEAQFYALEAKKASPGHRHPGR
ncbi:triose-phosphate transporter family-domain-containing protein [Polychytrium aggregatum]|uniref:triose-phosphate transporter family-domain-containing protein n=1 Tax=Polychytrium aggregatum TaxID=110093 RepID=UPI0022FE4545|nr:triose-phosphate transporter family-domain-containing protein [Polychytrium aggregatum]KAI9199695.1 triose-phosphate transporter family-domain-containing protein [Polychytrium aggregatum]